MATLEDLWDLTGRGEQDRGRYRERIKEALKNHLGDVIAHENVVTAPSGKTMRIRIEDVHEPRFRYKQQREGQPSGTGSGDPEDGLIGRLQPGQGSGAGSAGDSHQDGETVEIVLPVEEIASWVFRELQLPDLERKSGGFEQSEDALTARGRRGVLLDKKRTLLQHALREKASGRLEPWRDADRIYRRWQERSEPVFRAVVVLVRDASASIDDRMRFIIRTVCWWTVLWLRHNYGGGVEVRFVLHDTEAVEVSEEEFFRDRRMGGTHVSAGIEMAASLLERYPESEWNRYVCFFSDGDNWSSDSARLEAALTSLAAGVQMLAYGQVSSGSSSVLEVLRRIPPQHTLRYGHVDSAAVIRTWLTAMFGPQPREGKGA